MALFGIGRTKRSVGLDVGSHLVKLAVVDHGKDEPQLEKAVVRPLEGSAIVDGEVVDPGLVTDTIRSVFQDESIEDDHVAVGIGGRDVITKLIQMDRMDESDAGELIRWEAEQHIPFDIENVQLDFHVADPRGEGLRMKVLLVAAKRGLVDNKLALLQDAGVSASVVDVGAFALNNALEYNYPDAMTGVTGLVNIGHETTSVNIIEDGVPVLTVDLSFGTRRLAQDLQREEGLGTERAEAVLRGRGNGEVALVGRHLPQWAQEVGRGIERATTFLETGESDRAMGRLYLCGGGVRVPGLADALAERLEVETRVASALEGLQVKPGALEEPDLSALGPLLMLSVGLAIRRPR